MKTINTMQCLRAYGVLVLFAAGFVLWVALLVHKHRESVLRTQAQEWFAAYEGAFHAHDYIVVEEDIVSINSRGRPMMKTLSDYFGYQVSLLRYRAQGLNLEGKAQRVVSEAADNAQREKASRLMQQLLSTPAGLLPDTVRLYNTEESSDCTLPLGVAGADFSRSYTEVDFAWPVISEADLLNGYRPEFLRRLAQRLDQGQNQNTKD